MLIWAFLAIASAVLPICSILSVMVATSENLLVVVASNYAYMYALHKEGLNL